MKRFLLILAAVVSVLAFSGCRKKETQVLKIYSIIHEEETEALVQLFEEKTGIKVEYLRATTGEIFNRVNAEKENPQADIILGGASSYHIQADRDGTLEKYVSSEAAKVPAYAKADDGTWTGFCVLALGIGVNKSNFEKKYPGADLPSTWDDLLDPKYRGDVVMTNPAASSTAYLFVQDQLQRLGWDEGWNYLGKLSQSVGQFPDSGSAPPKLIGTGEYTLGVAYLHAMSKYNAEGFDIQLVAPPKTVADVDCISIIRNAKNMDAAKKFVDFMLGVEAQELMGKICFTIPVNPDASGVEGSIPVEKLDLVNYDVQKASDEKDKVLEKWSLLVR